MSAPFRFAHIHGFASSAASKKGVHLKRAFQHQDQTLHLPDLNRPSFEQLTFTGALGVLDELDATTGESPWRISASSMGGYLAALWASMHPAKVDRLVLLCPGFHLAERFEHLVGTRRMKQWAERGELKLPGPLETMVPVHYGFIEDAKNYPPEPVVPCPTVIIHGKKDPTIPIASSRRYAEKLARVTLVEVDDDHGLYKSLDLITETTLTFFEVAT